MKKLIQILTLTLALTLLAECKGSQPKETLTENINTITITK